MSIEHEHYIDDRDISTEVFFGREVPGVAIDEDTNRGYKDRSKKEIHRFCRVDKTDTGLIDDPHGDLEGIQMDLYKQLVFGEKFGLTQEHKDKLRNRGYARGGIPFKHADSRDYRMR